MNGAGFYEKNIDAFTAATLNECALLLNKGNFY
jgi:hypothetical protein